MCDIDLDLADLLRAEQSPVVFSMSAWGFCSVSSQSFLAVGSIKTVHLTRFNQPKLRILHYPRISIRELHETQPPSPEHNLMDRKASMHDGSPVKTYSDLDVVAWQSAPHRLLVKVEEQTNGELCASCHFECALGVSVRSDANGVRGNLRKPWI